MKHLFFASLVLLGLHSMSMAQYSLTVEAAPAVTEGLTTYRFYVNMADPTDRMSAVFGNDQASLLLETPDGAFKQRIQCKLECLRDQSCFPSRCAGPGR